MFERTGLSEPQEGVSTDPHEVPVAKRRRPLAAREWSAVVVMRLRVVCRGRQCACCRSCLCMQCDPSGQNPPYGHSVLMILRSLDSTRAVQLLEFKYPYPMHFPAG